MQLFEHQKEGVKFLESRSGVILADEMGLGKTMQAIVASKGDTLIVCPTTLKTNWAREIEMALGKQSIKIYSGSKIEEYSRGVRNFWIINYDVLAKHLDALLALYPETLILDEAHYIKNNASARSKATLKLCDAISRVYLLTGTPVANRPIEYYNLLKAIKHPIARDYYGFAKRYCGAFRQELKGGRSFLNVSGASNLIELHEKTKDCMLRRTKDKVTNLPPKIRAIVPVEMTADFKKQYATAWQDYLKCFNQTVTADQFKTLKEYDEKVENTLMARHMIELQKLKQITSLAKIDRLEEDIKNILEQENKVIIFTQYKETMRQIRVRLIKNRIASVSIDGETPQSRRQEAVDIFQTNEKVKVFLGNIKACGVGITLTKASIVVFADLDWTVTSHDQAEDRAHRIGQAGTVNVYYYVIKGTVEDKIIELLTKKRETIAQIIEGKTNRVTNTSVASDLLKSLYK